MNAARRAEVTRPPLRSLLVVQAGGMCWIHFLLLDPKRYLEPGVRRTGVGLCTWRLDGVDPATGRRRMGRNQYETREKVLEAIAAIKAQAEACLCESAAGMKTFMHLVETCPGCKRWRPAT